MVHALPTYISTIRLTFLATTSSLATDLTGAGGEGMGEGALVMSDMMDLKRGRCKVYRGTGDFAEDEEVVRNRG